MPIKIKFTRLKIHTLSLFWILEQEHLNTLTEQDRVIISRNIYMVEITAIQIQGIYFQGAVIIIQYLMNLLISRIWFWKWYNMIRIQESNLKRHWIMNFSRPQDSSIENMKIAETLTMDFISPNYYLSSLFLRFLTHDFHFYFWWPFCLKKGFEAISFEEVLIFVINIKHIPSRKFIWK